MSVPADIGGAIQVVPAYDPTTAEDGDITGAAIDRWGMESCVIAHASGVATGEPDSYTVETQLQDSDTTTSEDFDDVIGATITTLVADSTRAYADIKLGPMRQYVRLVTTVTFTGGSSPAVPVAGYVVLGGSNHGPVA